MKTSRLIIAGGLLGLVGYAVFRGSQEAPVDTETGEANSWLNGVDDLVSVAYFGEGLGMDISLAGLNFIKAVEGMKLTRYKDSAGLWTIGVGHLIKPFENYTTITEAEAMRLLAEDVAEAEIAVNRYVKVPLTQNQFDALVSFVFNVGSGAFRRSTLLTKLNAGDYAGAAAQFPAWRKAGGVVVSGLVNRRNKEVALFTGSGAVAV